MNKKLQFVYGIENINYGTTETHRLLYKGNNIGENCENLTIIILSYNRADSTIKLIKSIEEKCYRFRGEILIFDNGSQPQNIDRIESYIKKSKLKIKIIKYGKNLGVAKARNTAINTIKTDWAMFIDNDIYFIKDIFTQANRTIEQLGCKFINLPLLKEDQKTLFSFGGHIYVTPINNEIHVGNGSTYEQIELSDYKVEEDCLSTFLFGGSSIVNKQKFIELGGFDEEMFIGFEDLDFSIRIFNEGLKIRML